MSKKTTEDKEVDNNLPTAQEIKEQPKCFIIMPIADMPGYEARHFDRVYNHVIKPACIKAGFEPVRADDVTNSNFIVLDILRKIVEYDIAICDLSGRNPNAMYELGLRQAFNKKTVLIKDEKTINPFDVQAFRHVEYDSSLRIDNAYANINSITKALTSTFQADNDEVNSIVQLLKIQPASVGEKTVLSTQDTLIFEAIQEISKKIDHSMRIESNFANTSSNDVNSNDYDWRFYKQLQRYGIEQLLELEYRDNKNNNIGKFKGEATVEGKKVYVFVNKSNRTYIPVDSSQIYDLTEDIPF
ncbi:TPA: hypothetical protein ACI4DF_004331 [Enterobacter hormaechei]